MFKLLKNERGSALAFAILTTLVLMVVGTATLSLSSSEAKYSIRNEEQVQADYIARAGADITAKQIIDNPSSPTDGLNGNIGEGAYSTEVTYPDSSSARIVSTGVVDGAVAEVTLDMSGGTYQSLFTGIQQTGEEDLRLQKLIITYEDDSTVSIEANVDDLEDIHLNNDNEKDPNIVTAINNSPLPSFTLPDSTTFKTSLPETVKGEIIFIGDYKLNSIIKANSDKDDIIFDTQGHDQHIIVNKLDLSGKKGKVSIKGGGSVHLYILDSGDIDNHIYMNETDSTLFIYVNDGKTLSLQANSELTAYIYAPNAIISMTSADTTINGAIIGQIFNSQGNGHGPMGNFHYIPLEENPDESPIESGFTKTSYH